jgi:glutathione S-transferase
MHLTGVDWLHVAAIWAVIMGGILAVTFIASLLFWARYPEVRRWRRRLADRLSVRVHE